MVAYNGYTSSAKSNVVKSNCANIKKYIQAEVMKCSLGNSTTMNGELNCNKYIADDVATCAWMLKLLFIKIFLILKGSIGRL